MSTIQSPRREHRVVRLEHPLDGQPVDPWVADVRPGTLYAECACGWCSIGEETAVITAALLGHRVDVCDGSSVLVGDQPAPQDRHP
ncbi:hypothetical protein [Geodermatophilus sabuli]|uniref:hypothetical protein n=1 Tax=Geodermatophilus sabuli TaxID=1564158 RepID=UPI0013D762C4|nr:hypothetical protein [Geodermatophilus sabuli]